MYDGITYNEHSWFIAYHSDVSAIAIEAEVSNIRASREMRGLWDLVIGVEIESCAYSNVRVCVEMRVSKLHTLIHWSKLLTAILV